MLTSPHARTAHRARTARHGQAFQDQRASPDLAALSFEERVGIMADREAAERDTKRVTARLKFASLRQDACVEDIDLRTPSRPRSRAAGQARCRRLDRPTSEPADQRADRHREELARVRSRAQGLPRWPLRPLPARAAAVRGPGAGPRRRSPRPHAQGSRSPRPAHPRRLGLSVLNHSQRIDLLEILEDRSGRGSTLVTSQVPVEQLARGHRRSHPGRCHPRSPHPQRSPLHHDRRKHAQDHRQAIP